MTHLHEYCPGPGAAMSDSVVGKRTFVQSLRRFALPTLLFCFAMLGVTIGEAVPTLKAQVTCDSVCDEVKLVDTVNGCYLFMVVNRNASPLSRIRLTATNGNLPIAWVCSFDADPTSVPGYQGPAPAGSWNRDFAVLDPNYTMEYVPSNLSHVLRQCDTAYFRLCICCPERFGITVPIRIETFHDDPNVTPCPNDYNLSYIGEPCDIPIECDEDCPDISSTSSYDPVTGRSKVCVTITNKQPGSLYYFDLNIACLGTGAPNDWQVVSMPTGWVNVDFNGASGAGGTFASASGLDNCEEMTFCFETANCNLNYCESIRINYVGEGKNGVGICSLYTDAYLPNPNPTAIDKSCCPLDQFGVPKPPQITVEPPIVDPLSGKSEFCVTVQRFDNTPMNTIRISRTIGRLLCLTSIPPGWERTGGSATSDEFTRTTAPNEGCRSFKFCYETCDCDNVNTANGTINVNITGSGSGLTLPITIRPDEGNCCAGEGPFKEDQASISWSPASPACLTYTLLNSHVPCSDINDFHFNVPLGCIPSSITVPTGFFGFYDPLTRTVNVVPNVESGAVINCCAEMVVTVCFNNCIGPFPDFEWTWSSTYNGAIISQETEEYEYAAPKPAVDHGSKPRTEPMKGEQNFPNPFGASTDFKTTIPFNADGTGVARITIVDPTGKTVLTEEMEVTAPGKRFFYFTGDALPSGTYYYEIEFPKGKQVVAKRTMILVK